MTLDDLRCIKVCQRKMIACKLVLSCNIPSTDLLLMATSTIFWIYSWQMGFAKSSDKCLVIRKTTCVFALSLASVLFQQTFVKEYVYIRDQYIQESNDGEVLLIFWKGCTMLKPEIAQVPLVINIRQTLAGC